MACFVSVLVPPKDQPACGSDLQEAQGKTGLACDLKKSTQQRRAAAYFIRLYGAMNQLAQHCLASLHNTAKPGPEVITVAIPASRGITSGKLRCFFLENEAVDRSEKAQTER